LLFLPFLSPFATRVSWTSSSLLRQIANAHGIHNIVVSAILYKRVQSNDNVTGLAALAVAVRTVDMWA